MRRRRGAEGVVSFGGRGGDPGSERSIGPPSLKLPKPSNWFEPPSSKSGHGVTSKKGPLRTLRAAGRYAAATRVLLPSPTQHSQPIWLIALTSSCAFRGRHRR